jgi:hypothetical protein
MMPKATKVVPNAHPEGNAIAKARVITIRITPELHAALIDEAFERRTSVNKLAVAKLRLRGELLTRALQAANVTLSHR